MSSTVWSETVQKESPRNGAALAGVFSVTFSVVAAALIAVGFWALEEEKLFFHGHRPWRHDVAWLWGLFVLGATLGAREVGQKRSETLMLVSLVGGALYLKQDFVVLLGFAAAVVGVARLKTRLLLRCGLVFLLWLLPPLVKWNQPRAIALEHMQLFLVWATLPFSALYVLVERRRRQLDRVAWWEELAYLIALPRLLCPFMQPISAAAFFQSSEKPLGKRRLATTLALAIYGAGLHIALAKFRFIIGPELWGDPGQLLRTMTYVYALNAAHLFVGICLFRLLGFDLGSGFRWPILATSLQQFYRRFNYYVYEAVMSLFWFPLYGVLKRRVSRRAAFLVASYLAAFLGSYCLGYLLFPYAREHHNERAVSGALDATRIAVILLLWSFSYVPQLLPRSLTAGLPTWVRWLGFWGALGSLVLGAWAVGIAII